MKKFYVADVNELNEEEKRTGKVSYARLIDRYISDLVLCNNISEIDNSIFENMENVYDDNDNDEEYEEYDEDIDIFQYYLCNLSKFDREVLIDYGVPLSYSDLLDCDVLLVTHYGTAWSYVMTDVEWSENHSEC